MKRLLLGLLIAIATTNVALAQCKYHNTAFGNNEFLNYNLYYNWKFIWVKAGYASMYTVKSVYKGIPAYRSSLTTRGNHKVDDMFVLRDTLLCYDSRYMEPLYFRKGAREGKRYTVDQVWYNYSGGKVHLTQSRQHNDGHVSVTKNTRKECVFDMISIFLRARSFNPEGWKKGTKINFPIVDGNSVDPAYITYKGKTVVKADNGHKYRCLMLSYYEYEDKKMKEIARFYVSDDTNHVPVRIDMFLRFGAAKAFLTSYKGLRNPVGALVK